VSRKAQLALLIIAVLVLYGLMLRGRFKLAVPPSRVDGRTAATAAYPASTAAHHPPAAQEQGADALKPTVDAGGRAAICGFPKAPVDTRDPIAVMQFVGVVSEKAGARWLAALQDSDDLRARASGLLLEGKLTGADQMQPTSEQTRDALAQLAAGARDPAVYAMAVNMCGTDTMTPIHGACDQITLESWAHLDRGNAIPWLLLAGKARATHDVAAESEAFNRAANADKVDSYYDSLDAFSESEIPGDVTPLEQFYFASQVLGIESAARAPQFALTSRHCSTDAVRDPNVREQCNTLAELLVAKGTTLIDFAIGIGIGARTGWSNERVNDLTQQKNALMQALNQSTPTANDELWTCEGVRLGTAYALQRARLGELGAARAALEHSGQTVQELAKVHTAFMDKILRDAAQREQEKPSESEP
jgi:hypothetical protein